MKRNLFYSLLAVLILGCNGKVWAEDLFLPAGTLLRCTLSEPNFSSKTTEEGDPVLCMADTLVQFGHSAFPRGAYFVGHLETSKEPGLFFGKGSLGLRFDHVGLPGADLPISAKVISVRGYKVDRKGDIIGHGHATRDAVEWMFPPLWPWKVVTLPGRGPRPVLKGEVPITIRLMETLAVPQVSDSGWHTFGKSSSSSPAPQSFTRPASYPVDRSSGVAGEVRQLPNAYPAGGQLAATVPTSLSRPLLPLTLIALKNETIFGASDYWIEDPRLSYTLSDGTQGSVDLSDVNWGRTTQLNSERGIRLVLRTGRRLN